MLLYLLIITGPLISSYCTDFIKAHHTIPNWSVLDLFYQLKMVGYISVHWLYCSQAACHLSTSFEFRKPPYAFAINISLKISYCCGHREDRPPSNAFGYHTVSQFIAWARIDKVLVVYNSTNTTDLSVFLFSKTVWSPRQVACTIPRTQIHKPIPNWPQLLHKSCTLYCFSCSLPLLASVVNLIS